MANSHFAQRPQPLGQSPFFYYKPETSSEHRHQGLFSPQPNTNEDSSQMQVFQQQPYHPEMTIPAQPQMMYPRPSAISPQGFLPSRPAYETPSTMNTMASPQPMQQKAAFLHQHEGLPLTLDTVCGAPGVHVYPSTPPLSVSGSTVDSPPSSCGYLPTPVAGPFSLWKTSRA